MNKDRLESILQKLDINDKTETGEMALELFKNTAGRTNITQDEMVLLFINKAMFRGLGLDDLSPVDDFLELKKSVGGFAVQKFVEGVGGMANMRAGGSVGGWMRDRLFSRQP